MNETLSKPLPSTWVWSEVVVPWWEKSLMEGEARPMKEHMKSKVNPVEAL